MHKGAQGSKPLTQNKIAQSFDSTNQRAGEPKDEQLRLSYGVIVDVDTETNKAFIDIFGEGGKRIRIGSTDRNEAGALVSIMQPMTVIHHLFGSLRKGLIVRVFWKGKHVPGKEAVAEIISDDPSAEFVTGNKGARSNELNTGPHDIFTGGVNL